VAADREAARLCTRARVLLLFIHNIKLYQRRRLLSGREIQARANASNYSNYPRTRDASRGKAGLSRGSFYLKGDPRRAGIILRGVNREVAFSRTEKGATGRGNSSIFQASISGLPRVCEIPKFGAAASLRAAAAIFAHA
jgi:hypothetical protein